MRYAPRTHLLLATCAVLGLVGCSSQAPSLAPTSAAPPVPAIGPMTATAAGLWTTEKVVIAVTDLRTEPPWPSAETVGDVTPDVRWRVQVLRDNVIELHEDLRHAPWDHTIWTARLDGVRFEASFSNEDYLLWMPQFRGGTLRGTFSDDFSTFEAESTLSWGPPGADLTVTYRWKGAR